MTAPPLDENTRLEMHSGDYVGVMENLPLHRLTRLLPLMDLRADDVLVDLACGPGALAEVVCPRIGRYEGVDFSPEFVASATARAEAKGLGNASFHCADVADYCAARPDHADVITAFDFSEHIYDDEFVKIFSAARHALRPGGRLYVYTPDADFFYEKMKAWGIAKQFPQHVAVRDEAANRRLLAQCGFAEERIRCERPSHFNVFRHLHPLSKLPGIGRYFRAKLFFVCYR